MFSKILLGAVAMSMVATPMIATEASAQQRRTVTTVTRDGPYGREVSRTTVRQTRQWTRGQRFDRRYASRYRQVDWRQYRGRHLYAPPRGYHWVQSGNDAVLVAIASGVIGAVVGGALR
jgi:Ni/Co efflux regulator RcnB